MFKRRHLVSAPPHACLQHFSDKRRHAAISLGRFDAQPVGNVIAQSDGDIPHGASQLSTMHRHSLHQQSTRK
jgi:hypothetical protein